MWALYNTITDWVTHAPASRKDYESNISKIQSDRREEAKKVIKSEFPIALAAQGHRYMVNLYIFSLNIFLFASFPDMESCLQTRELLMLKEFYKQDFELVCIKVDTVI